jgi:hypothetical protein
VITASIPITSSIASEASRDNRTPSAAWPPPNTDDMISIAKSAVGRIGNSMDLPRAKEEEAVQGFSVDTNPDVPESEKHGGKAGASQNTPTGIPGNTAPGTSHDLSMMIGNLVEIKDQIQMYTTNHLNHTRWSRLYFNLPLEDFLLY